MSDTAASETGRTRDKPWIFRTYAGHSTAVESNALYRGNLAKGQTGLSIAFDLPTQTGYDPDHELAKGEVGKVGVSVAHLGDMRTLLDGIPLATMNTSMTINATAPWLLALYVAVADEQGAPRDALTGTTQNDIVKEYLSRGTYIFPPEPSLRLTRDTILFGREEMPKWNPMNVCSYHLQEAGATPVQEVAFALATACAVLDRVKAKGVPEADFAQMVGRISFFVNAGMRFVTEICKLRAFADLWDEVCRDRYGIADEKSRRFRYGVQVNSLGLTEQQPENNVHRILIEMLAVTLSKKARARAVQLPAWNEAMGLPRPWDQQWSLRMQQILALETDLLEYEDIFDGSAVIEREVAAIKEAARAELEAIDRLGGAVACVESGYMKRALVESNAARVSEIEEGERVVVGVNTYREGEPSPLVTGDRAIMTVSEDVEQGAIAALKQWRAARDESAAQAALAALEAAARSTDANVMEPSIACAKAGVTTGEWGERLRAVFGQYRAPTGVTLETRVTPREREVRLLVTELSETLGRAPTMVVGKPGLDGHSNGAEQIALRARDVGMEVAYDGIRQTPAEIVARAAQTKAHVIGLSILSGSHVPLVREVMARLRLEGLDHIPVVVGGIISNEDALVLSNMGVSKVYTPKDYEIDAIMGEIVGVIARAADKPPAPDAPPATAAAKRDRRAARGSY
ncbi:protein meaA [Salinarimonas chemoclinalis]|uniref:protein meaA n=1 Tax=Salinarimonas chemoclinalis TaxID=3241599 RepID=UPI0035566379